jgi:hypothetical protein
VIRTIAAQGASEQILQLLAINSAVCRIARWQPHMSCKRNDLQDPNIACIPSADLIATSCSSGPK